MNERLNNAVLAASSCLLCGSSDARVLGVRGNREYNGADPKAEPHLVTNVVECRPCGFIYTNPEIKGVEFLEHEHYDDPENYQSDAGSDVLTMYEHRVGYIKQFKSGGDLLDVGAGKGEFVFTAGKNGFQATGIEPSPRFCEYGRETFGISMENGFLGQVPSLNGRHFDVITMHHVLEHVDQPLELLREIKGHLNDDGVIYVEVPNTASHTLKLIDVYFRLRGLKWSSRLSPLHPPFHKYGYTRRSLTYLARLAELDILSVDTFSLFSRNAGANMGMASRLKRAPIAALDALGNRDMLAFVFRKGSGSAE